MKKRVVGYDIIKSMAMFFVVMLHYSFYTRFYSSGLAGTAVTVLCVVCVPLFFAVNGALLLPRKMDEAKHYRKTLNIVIVVTIWRLLAAAFFVFVDGSHPVTLKDLVLFLLGGAVSNLAAVLAIGVPDRVIIGASGAVSAVIGAYLALFPNAKLGVVLPLGLFLQFVKAPASLLIGIWALLQVIFAYIGPAFGAVAWSAHIAGFLFGVVFALFVRAAIARRLRKRQGY